MENLKKIQDVNLQGKVVLVRVDHNVVKKGKIKDTYRIDSSIPTIKYILEKGGKPVLMTHVGRPKDKKTGFITVSEETSVKPVIEYLKSILNLKIETIDFDVEKAETISDLIDTNKKLTNLKNGISDILYLPNTRWFYGEEDKGDLREKFSKDLASLSDIFVNDAFGSWQPHASTVGVAKILPAFAGLLMQKEIENLHRVLEPTRPMTAVVAGSKFDTKIGPLNSLLEKADYLIIGGVIYNAYLCAKYGFKIKGITEEDIKDAHKFVKLTEKYPQKLIELPYIIESDFLEKKEKGHYRTHNIYELKADAQLNYVLDVDAKSFMNKEVKKALMNAKTIFVNAVMGYTPNFSEGTIALDMMLDKNVSANKFLGGGDTLQEFKNLLPDIYSDALKNDKFYLFTGGGTILKAIEQGSALGLEPVKLLLK